MRCIFLHLPKTVGARNEIMVLPMGLFSLAGYLRDRGHAVQIVHAGLAGAGEPFDPVAYVARRRVRAVFLDLHWTRQTRPVIDFARALKRVRPNVRVILGGFTASFFAEQILSGFPEVDAVVRGDGEVPAARLVERLERGDEDWTGVPNLVHRLRGKVQSNPITFGVDAAFAEDLDHACFELLAQRDEYLRRCLYADFDTSTALGARHRYAGAFFYNPGKGCPFLCRACGGTWWARNLVRSPRRFCFFSTEKALRDLLKAWKHGARTWRVSFDPQQKRGFYLGLFARLRAAEVRFRLIFDCFPLPDAAFLRAVARTFTPDSVVVFSAECGSDRVRRLNRSPLFTNAALLRAVQATREAGLEAHVFLSAGLPFETRRDLGETAKLIRALRRRGPVGITVCPMELDPGSLIFLQPERHGVRPALRTFRDFYRNGLDESRPYYETEHLSEPEILAAVAKLRRVADDAR
jgi:radical SAM superfamily enzyme YgiQ (UPF0313 family)